MNPSKLSPLAQPESDAIARDDALRDFHGASPEGEAEQGLMDPIEVDALTGELEPVGDAPFPNDEQYDALAPEDLGSEWLRRATQADSVQPEGFPPRDELDGDSAEEIPVGATDSEGNTEFHPKKRHE